jgi:hypothetical protein
MYKNIKEDKRGYAFAKVSICVFLHFESDEWGEIEFLEFTDVKLVCSDLSSKLNMMGWYNVPRPYISLG